MFSKKKGENEMEDNTIIGRISKGEYPEKVVKTKYGEFKVKFPSGRDVQLIGRLKASYMGGFPSNQFDINFLNTFERDATLNVIITSYPDEVGEEFRKDNFVDFPDEEVKNSIYKEFNTFLSDTKKSISEAT